MTTALLERQRAQPAATARDRTVPRYRLPRPGDLLTVRSTDPYLDEAHVVIETVADNGGYLLVSGTWGGHELEVVLRRVGDPHTQDLEN